MYFIQKLNCTRFFPAKFWVWIRVRIQIQLKKKLNANLIGDTLILDKLVCVKAEQICFQL
jgi:hypothetical protein